MTQSTFLVSQATGHYSVWTYRGTRWHPSEYSGYTTPWCSRVISSLPVTGRNQGEDYSDWTLKRTNWFLETIQFTLHCRMWWRSAIPFINHPWKMLRRKAEGWSWNLKGDQDEGRSHRLKIRSGWRILKVKMSCRHCDFYWRLSLVII